MVLFAPDAKARQRSTEEIAAEADRARAVAGLSDCHNLDICDYLERLSNAEIPRFNKEKLQIKLFETNAYEHLAFVTFNPVTLHVDKDVWKEAKAGEPYARYILAHELGHILLHEKYMLAYSKHEAVWLKKNNSSAEDQANKFADFFLYPNRFYCPNQHDNELATYHGVPLKVIARRRKSRSASYTGDACPECANFTMVRDGTCLKCDTCGSMTGCG